MHLYGAVPFSPWGTGEEQGSDGRRARAVKARLLFAVSAVCLSSAVTGDAAAAATGDLTQKPGAAACISALGFCMPVAALDGAISVTVSPDGKNAYAAASTATRWRSSTAPRTGR